MINAAINSGEEQCPDSEVKSVRRGALCVLKGFE